MHQNWTAWSASAAKRCLACPRCSPLLPGLLTPDGWSSRCSPATSRRWPESSSAPLGLTEHLDLTIGAYGDVSEVRGDLVPVARLNAAARYGADFAGRATVLVGDTPMDVEAATVNGARCVAVATGSFTAEQLAAAGADVVLADLADTALAVSAILDGTPTGRSSRSAV